MADPHSTRKKWSRIPMAPDKYAAYVELQRQKSTGRRHKPESIQKMREIWKGRQFPSKAHERARAVNTGRPLTAEHRQKISDALSGLSRTAEHQAKLSEAQRGRPKSAETRAKISASLTGRSGTPHEQPAKDAISSAQRARWAGLRSAVSRSSTEYKAWRASVLRRDNGTCQECGARNVIMHAHHIKPFNDYPDMRYDVSNGVTMCASCHVKLESPLVKLESQIKRARTILKKLREQGVDVSKL